MNTGSFVLVFFAGAVTVLAILLLFNGADKINRVRRNKKQRLEDSSQFRRACFLALSKHNNESKVDRLLSLSK